MRVLHVGKYFHPYKGGVEIYLRDALVELARMGVDCAALVHQHEAGTSDSDERFETGGTPLRLVRAGVQFNLLFTPLSRSFPGRFERLLDEFGPDIIHLHLPNPSAFWALASRRARRVPWVLQWHADVIASSLPMKAAYAAYRPFESALLRRAAAVVVSSQPYLEASAPLRPFDKKCRVVPLGIDAGRYSSVPDPGRGNETTPVRGPFNLLAVGRLTYYKGFQYLLQAVARVPGVKLRLVGGGEEAGALKALAANLRLGDRVAFLGSLGDKALAREFAHCDALCLPSIERTEAFGVVLLEAMRFGKPILASRLHGSGMDWLVDEGINGLKFEPADPDSLAGALERLAGDPLAARAMGRRGRERFEAGLTIARSVDGLLDVYGEVLKAVD